jgi:hypothetical protein
VLDRQVWTNSIFGRFLGTGFGIFCMALPFDTEDGGAAWRGTSTVILGDVLLTLVGVLVIVAFWTSRLLIAEGKVVATSFFVSRSMPLEEVAAVTPSAVPFLGIKIQRKDGSGIRTLVSGQSWDEWWTPRATQIARDIEHLAKVARGELNGSGDAEPVTSKGSTGRGRHTRQ